MGTVKAAQCATAVSQQFPNVRLALMVGIGAGIPRFPKHDIRLGDLVVSISQDGHPGVVQYDFVKYENDKVILKGCLDKPPPILISADGLLQEDEMMMKSSLKRSLKKLMSIPMFKRPDTGDILFDENFHHINKGSNCSGCEATGENKVIFRPHVQITNQSFIAALYFREMELSRTLRIGIIYNETSKMPFASKWKQQASWTRFPV